MTIDEYKRQAYKLTQGSTLRYPQALYNHLCDVRPNLAREIVGTDKDPFYASNMKDERVVRFLDFLATNWERQ